MNSFFIDDSTKFKVKKLQGQSEDASDIINYKWSSIIILIFVAISTLKQYLIEPIQCFIPAKWPKPWEEYTETYCWVENTYYVDADMSKEIPEASHRIQAQIKYYQWTPFILVIQALGFYLPHLFWNLCATEMGYNIDAIIKEVHDINTQLSNHSNEKTRKNMVQFMIKIMNFQDANSKQSILKSFLRNYMVYINSGNYLFIMYLFHKILYIINQALQILFMTKCLGMNNVAFGAKIFIELINGMSWKQSGIFPRTTLCDIHIKTIDEVYSSTIQCILPINMLYEKIFIFIWFWCTICLLLSISSFISWTISFQFKSRKSFLDKSLQNMDQKVQYDEKKIFLKGFLKIDGIFIFYIIKKNLGTSAATQLLKEVFNKWKEDINNSQQSID